MTRKVYRENEGRIRASSGDKIKWTQPREESYKKK